LAEGRLDTPLSGAGEVRSREERTARTFATYFFLVTFVFYILKPVRESLLIGVNPAWWPFADLATALLIGFVVALNTRLLDRLPRRTYLTASLLFFIASLFVFWYVFDMIRTSQIQTPVADSSGIFFLLWVQTLILSHKVVPVFVFCFWSDVFIAMSVTQFWIAVNDVIQPYQAKRLVGRFVTGGLLGGIAGSAVAALASSLRVIRPEGLLLVGPFVLVLALVVVNVVYAGQRKIDATAGDARLDTPVQAGYLESFRTILRVPYLKLLAGMLASAIIAGTLINYQFKTVVKFVFGDNNAAKTSFIALFFLIILVISTAVHLLTTGRFLRRYGIGLAVSVAPLILLLGSLAVFLIPAGLIVLWAFLVRGFDKGFDNTLSQSVRELLYIPIPADIKYKAKLFIDMFVNKFATGFAAALFWVLQGVRSFNYRPPLAVIRETGLLALLFIAAWLVLTRLVYRGYPDVLKPAIRQIWVGGDKAITQIVDVEETLKIFNTIQSRERSTTLYLMNLFDLVHGKTLTPELKELLGIKRDEIKARAMDALFDVGGSAFFPGLEEAIEDAELQHEIDLVFLLPTYQEIMGRRLREIVDSSSEVDRIEAAKIIGRMVSNDSTLETLGRLLRDPSFEVVLYALESAAVHRHPGHVPLILPRLADPQLRAETQKTLAAYGPGIEGLLQPVLRSAAEPLDVRRAVPEVLARVGSQRAADILLDELARHDEALEQALIDALFRIRTERPQVRFREKAVRAEVVVLARKACDVVLDPPADPAEAKAALDIRIKRVFDLMTLMHHPEDIIRAYQNILQGTAKSADYSLAHLDTLLDPELKGLLSPLIEPLPPEERAALVRKAMKRQG
jgi:AAA family ATP:ADP antiporter